MKRIVCVGLIFVLILLLNGCAKEGLSQSIGIRGKIKEIYLSEDGDTIAGILVEGEVHEDTMYDYASVEIDESTSIYRGEEEVTIEDLEEGLKVEIIFAGPVAESYPVQGVAEMINIIEE